MSETSVRESYQPKWQGISSLVLGLICVVADVYIVAYFYLNLEFVTGWVVFIYLLLVFIFGGWLFAAVGFIFGIMGLKYTNRILAIAGVILCVIGFIAYAILTSEVLATVQSL